MSAKPEEKARDGPLYTCPACGSTSLVVVNLYSFTHEALGAAEGRPGFTPCCTMTIPPAASIEHLVLCANCRRPALAPKLMTT